MRLSEALTLADAEHRVLARERDLELYRHISPERHWRLEALCEAQREVIRWLRVSLNETREAARS